MPYGGAHRVVHRADRDPDVPDLHVLRHQDGEEPDLCDRLVDLIDRVEEHTRRHVAGEEIPLLEQLELEREKVDLLTIVGLDARWVDEAVQKARERIGELSQQLIVAVEGHEGA